MWRYPLLLSSALRAQRGRRLFRDNLLTPVVMRGIAYRQFCTPSGSNIQTWLISQAVIDALSNPTYVPDATHRGKVSGLLDLANLALAGLPTGAASLSDINDAIDSINHGFDECAMLVACP